MTAIPRWLKADQGNTPTAAVGIVRNLFQDIALDLKRHLCRTEKGEMYFGNDDEYAEWKEGMRKLLEAKDCFVRVAVSGSERAKAWADRTEEAKTE